MARGPRGSERGQPASRVARPLCRWRRPQSTRVRRWWHTASRNQAISEPGTPAGGCEHLQRRVAQHALCPLWICLPPKGASAADMNGIDGAAGVPDACLVAPSVLLRQDPMQAGARDPRWSSPRWTSRHGGYHIHKVVEGAGRRRAAARGEIRFLDACRRRRGRRVQRSVWSTGRQTDQACAWPPPMQCGRLSCVWTLVPAIQGTNMVLATVSRRRGRGMTKVAVAKGSWRESLRTDGPMVDWLAATIGAKLRMRTRWDVMAIAADRSPQ